MSEEKHNDAQTKKGAGSASGKTSEHKPTQAGSASGSSTAKPTSGGTSTPAKGGSASAASPSKASDSVKASSGQPGNTSKTKSGPSAGADKKPSTATPPPASSVSPAKSDNSRTTASSAPAAGSGGAVNRGQSRRAGDGNPGRKGMLVAVIALIVAIVALIGAGWLWYRGEQKLTAMDSRVQTVEQGIQSSVQEVVMPRLSKVDQRVQSLSSELQSTQQKLQQQGDRLGQIQDSLKDAQSQAAQLADRLEGNSQRWDLNQIESLLQAANQRLQLFEDPAGARQALQLASDAIQRKGDPRLFDIRSEIANEIAAISALPQPDTESLTLDLAAMIKQVPDLPLASTVPGAYNQSGGDDSESNQAGTSDAQSGDDGMSLDDVKSTFTQGWAHFKNSVGQALSGMMTVSRSDGTQGALLPPNQMFFLKQNLQLELRAARLALLEGDTDSYRESLGAARQWLDDYYDTDASQVSSMRERLEQMGNIKLDWDAPDISQSLSMLRDRMRESGSGSDDGESESNSSTQSASPAEAESGDSSSATDGSDDAEQQQSGDQSGQGGA